jgi:capsular exopolysaccharide synthesis family protein
MKMFAVNEGESGRRDDRFSNSLSGQGLNILYSKTRVVELDSAVLEKNKVISGVGTDEKTGAYKLLRTQILHRMRENNWKSLAITSPGEGEGKTLTAINLAISLARDVNHTVLLVDLDMRRPSVAKYLGFNPIIGIDDCLLDNAPIHDALFNPGIERLVVLPCRNSFASSSELLSSPPMQKLAEELKERYPERLVIFDLPPLLARDDLLAFSPHIDAVLLVAREGKTRKADLRRAMEMLKVVNVAGTMLNSSQEEAVRRW